MKIEDFFDEERYGDWSSAFGAAGALEKRREIAEVLSAKEGANDGPSWTVVAKMNNGKFGALVAWCDYTGWDCQAGGKWQEFDTLAEAEAMVAKEVWDL